MKILFNEQKTRMTFLLSLSMLFFFSLVSAAVDTSSVTDVFQVNDIISYNKPCMNNGTWCSSVTLCNYTFYDRDNSIRHNNVLATEVGVNGASIWQYNISHDETGLYKVDMVCVDNGDQGSNTLYYEITGDGTNSSLGFFILILGISLGIIILGLVMTDAPVTILGSFGLYFVAIYTLLNGIAGTKDPITTWAIGIILLAMAMYISIRSAYELIVD